jgi:hypothetical protein
MKRIAVLGCGPTGLAAAQACSQAGHRVDIYSRMTKSKLYGSQYLHEPIPGLDYPEAPVSLMYRLDGAMDGYRRKVYGPDYSGPVSPSDYEGEHKAWDIRWTYDELWEKFFNQIRNVNSIHPRDVLHLQRDYVLVINTIPRTQICFTPEHVFDGQPIWAMGDAPGIQSVPIECDDNTVVCSGRPCDDWYRISNIFGYKTVEWSYNQRPKHNGRPLNAAVVHKPLKTNCNCFPQVLHVGRFGAWRKGVVVHHAYHEVEEVVG